MPLIGVVGTFNRILAVAYRDKENLYYLVTVAIDVFALVFLLISTKHPDDTHYTLDLDPAVQISYRQTHLELLSQRRTFTAKQY